MRTVTPYDSVSTLDVCDIFNSISEEVEKKYELDEATLDKYEEAQKEFRDLFSEHVMHASRVAGVQLDSGRSAVDPHHFDRIEYLAVWHFLDLILCGEQTLWRAQHELSLMLQEIHDLRNVLADRCGIDWYEYRKKFPLLAQDYL